MIIPRDTYLNKLKVGYHKRQHSYKKRRDWSHHHGAKRISYEQEQS